MRWTKKTATAAEKASGKTKTATGKATGDRKLKFKGKKQQAKASLKNAGDDTKDMFKP